MEHFEVGGPAENMGTCNSFYEKQDKTLVGCLHTLQSMTVGAQIIFFAFATNTYNKMGFKRPQSLF